MIGVDDSDSDLKDQEPEETMTRGAYLRLLAELNGVPPKRTLYGTSKHRGWAGAGPPCYLSFPLRSPSTPFSAPSAPPAYNPVAPLYILMSRTRASTQAYTNTRKRKHIHTHTLMRARAHTHTHTSTHARTYVRLCSRQVTVGYVRVFALAERAARLGAVDKVGFVACFCSS